MRASATKIKERAGHMIWGTIIRQTKDPSQNLTLILNLRIALHIYLYHQISENYFLNSINEFSLMAFKLRECLFKNILGRNFAK